MSCEKRGTSAQDSRAFRHFASSQEVYEEHKIIGSPHKDVLGEERAKVIGAEINTSDRAARKGVATVGAPICKRLAMSWLTLQLCQLNQTTDVLHLCVVGAWTSIAMYRRPLMSIFTATHRLVDAALVESEHPRIVRLPRSVADELTVMSVLALLAVADVGALFEGRVFATDASEEKGAITSANVPITVVEKLWRSRKTKGAYSRLKTQYEILLDRLGIRDEAAVDDTTQYDTLSSFQPGPSKQLAFQYDFIEVYAGSARVSQAAARLGMRVGPPVDISYSGELNMTLTRVVAWLSYMLVSGNLGSIMVEPVCATFSIMRRPALRTRDDPYGLSLECPKTLTGNLLALRALSLLHIAWRLFIPGLIEQPWTSLMRFLPPWQAIASKPRVNTVRSDSCAFGSPHQKSFRFMAVNMHLTHVQKRCSRDHSHVVVEGKFTKASASYTEELAAQIALCFFEAVKSRQRSILEYDDYKTDGLENQLVNFVATSADWRMKDVWSFSTPRHINLLEMKSLVRLSEKLARSPSALESSTLWTPMLFDVQLQKEGLQAEP